MQEAEITWPKLERCLVDAFMPNLLNTLKRHMKKHGRSGKGSPSIISSAAVAGSDAAPSAGKANHCISNITLLECLRATDRALLDLYLCV